jgi:23S rRNA (guanosine2251-2'-O)-methyltransferase
MENRNRGRVNRDDASRKKFYKPIPRPNPEDFVFGLQSVLETLRSEKEVDKILMLKEFGNSEIEKLAKERSIPVQRVPAEKLTRVTAKNHQGVIAFTSTVNYSDISNVVAEVFEKGEVPLVLILDRITDVRNFGAIARTAECSGVHAIVIPKRGAAQINSDAMKTSSGALSYMPVCREYELVNVVNNLKNSGFQIVSCSEKGEGFIYDPDFSVPTAIIMGSEEDGISDSLLTISDYVTQIPMQGNVGSLNVSVATGVILYEAIRQRR